MNHDLLSTFDRMFIHITENERIKITDFPYLILRPFMSQRMNKSKLLIFHIWSYIQSCHDSCHGQKQT